MSIISVKTDDDLRVFRVDEVADRLSVSVATVKRLIDAGELKVAGQRRKGSKLLVTARSLRDYIYGDAEGVRV